MNKSKKEQSYKKGFSLFTKFFISLFIICVWAILFGLSYFYDYLKNYQESLPTNVIDELFDRLDNGDYTQAAELSGFLKNDFNTDEDFENYMDYKFLNKYKDLKYLKTSSEEDSQNYDLYLEKNKKGSVTIVKSGNVSKYGFDLWEVKSLDVLTYLDDIVVTAPKNVKILINGKPLSERYKIKTEFIEEFPLSPEETEKPSTNTYKLKNILQTPEITAKTPNEEMCDKTEENQNVITFTWPKFRQQQLQGLAKEATENYAYVITQATDNDIFLKYLVKGTPYYKTISTYNSSWYIAQPEISGDKFENFKVTRYNEYDEYHADMDLAFDYTIYTTNGKKESKFPFSYTIYFLYKDEEWQILEMVTN